MATRITDRVYDSAADTCPLCGSASIERTPLTVLFECQCRYSRCLDGTWWRLTQCRKYSRDKKPSEAV